MIDERRRSAFHDKMTALAAGRTMLEEHPFTPKQIAEAGIAINQDGQRRNGMDLLSFPGVSLPDLAALYPETSAIAPEIREQLEIEALYRTYVERQAREAIALKRDEDQRIPEALDYATIRGLSNELRGKLERVRPRTLGQAGRIDGMTPAALALILTQIRQDERKRA